MDKEIFIKQLSELVAFETVSGNIDENSKALDYVQKLINEKASVKRIKNKNTEILIAGKSESDTPDVAYMVHMDVVSAMPEQFKTNIIGDKIFGRGTSDMKFSIPIGVELFNAHLLSDSKLTYCLVITTDEEIGGYDGGKYLADVLNFRPGCLIVPDGGDNLSFVNKAKGVCQLSIASKGSPAHASRPWMGKNAIEPLIILGEKLIQIYSKDNLSESWNTTMNIGQIHGGVSVNQVCPEAVMKLDFRYPETDSIENISKTVEELCKQSGEDLTITKDSTGFPTFTDTELPIVKNFLNAMKNAYGKEIVISETYGASDARHFAKYNIPILMMKPMGGEIHSEKEWVSIESSLKFLDGLKIFLGDMEKGYNLV